VSFCLKDIIFKNKNEEKSDKMENKADETVNLTDQRECV